MGTKIRPKELKQIPNPILKEKKCPTKQGFIKLILSIQVNPDSFLSCSNTVGLLGKYRDIEAIFVRHCNLWLSSLSHVTQATIHSHIQWDVAHCYVIYTVGSYKPHHPSQNDTFLFENKKTF